MAREKQMQYFKGNREIEFELRDLVYVKDYKCPAKPIWRKAIINKISWPLECIYVKRWMKKD